MFTVHFEHCAHGSSVPMTDCMLFHCCCCCYQTNVWPKSKTLFSRRKKNFNDLFFAWIFVFHVICLIRATLFLLLYAIFSPKILFMLMFHCLDSSISYAIKLRLCLFLSVCIVYTWLHRVITSVWHFLVMLRWREDKKTQCVTALRQPPVWLKIHCFWSGRHRVVDILKTFHTL